MQMFGSRSGLISLGVALLSFACTAEERVPEAESRTHGPTEQDEGEPPLPSNAPDNVVEPAPSRFDPSKAYPRPAAPSVELLQTDDTFIIEVRDPEGFDVSAENPFLHVGDSVFPSAGSSTRVGPYGLVYKLTREQFDSLADGAEIKLGRREFPIDSYGKLQKSSLMVTGTRGAP